MPGGARPGPQACPDADHERKQAALAVIRSGGLTVKDFATRLNLSYNRARYYVLTGGTTRRRGPSPFFTAEEEALLARYLITNATIGRGLSQEDLCRVCASYLGELSVERQAAARERFGGTLVPGRSWVKGFLSRHPELRRYRVGTLEEGRARNARPDVVANWFALLTLLYRDLRINSPRQVWNMDETHVHARMSAMSGRQGILGEVGMLKPEVILPPFASGAGACTAAFCVSAAGVVAPHFIVVEGQVPGHAVLTETKQDGTKTVTALSSLLNDGAVVWRRSPPGFDKSVFDVWATMFAKFAQSYFKDEAKLLSLDGAKVHLSPAGLLTLLKANVHVVAEPSKMSHILQALDNPSAFGRYQPKVRRRVREIAMACRDAGRPFNTAVLMSCIGRAASESLTTDALVSAFHQVGMWPLDPLVIKNSELCKGADTVLPDVDLERLTSRLIPTVRKDMSQPIFVNGTLSTAGRGTVLTAPEILAAMADAAAGKEAVKEAKAAKKRARELTAEDKKRKGAAVARARHARVVEQEASNRRIVWAEIASDAAHEAGCRLRDLGMVLPSTAKSRRRLAAARVRVPRVHPRILWRVLAGAAAGVGSRLHI